MPIYDQLKNLDLSPNTEIMFSSPNFPFIFFRLGFCGCREHRDQANTHMKRFASSL